MINTTGNPDYVTKLPEWKRYCPETDDEADKRARWNASYDPPKVGQRIEIKLNGWGRSRGNAVGYVHTGGWLMICVKPDTRPPWHLKEMPNRTVCLFAGIELAPLWGST
jgi:hypothetical protein